MKAKYWIKLYHEILDDGKMGRLPDRLWRRTIELFLIAGEEHDKGHLPSIEDMTWRLRLSKEELLEDLQKLAELNIVTQLDDGTWFVTNFAERQRARTNAERQQRYRDRQRKAQYYGDDNGTDPSQGNNDGVTKRNTEVEAEADIDKEVEADADVEGGDHDHNPFSLYEQATASTLTRLLADQIGDMVDECEKHRERLPPAASGADLSGDEWVCAAIKEASASTNKFGLRYVGAILDRWMEEGFDSDKVDKKRAAPKRTYDDYEIIEGPDGKPLAREVKK